MMKTNARETSRLPSTSIGTGRSRENREAEEGRDSNQVRVLGALRAAASAAAATTGTPTAIVARTYHRSAAAEPHDVTNARHCREVEPVDLRPAGAGATRDGERTNAATARPTRIVQTFHRITQTSQ